MSSLNVFSVLSLHQNGWLSLLLNKFSNCFLKINLFILFSICSFYNSFNCFSKICYKLVFYKMKTCFWVQQSFTHFRKQVLQQRIKSLQRISICSSKISKITKCLFLFGSKSLVWGAATVLAILSTGLRQISASSIRCSRFTFHFL